MGHQLTFTAVERSGGSNLQEIPAANSSATVEWAQWDAAIQLLDANPALQEELASICPDEPGDIEPLSWPECVVPGHLARLLKRARQLCGLAPLEEGEAFRIVCVAADGTWAPVVAGQVALVSGDETLILSVAKGLITRINRVHQASTSEPLSDGLEVSGSPVGESRALLARVEATGLGPEPTDVLAAVLKVCLVAKARRGRVQVTLCE